MCNKVAFMNRLPLYPCKLPCAEIKSQELVSLFIRPYSNNKQLQFLYVITVVILIENSVECQ